MNHLIFEQMPCDDILDTFGRDKVVNRFDVLFRELNIFIESNSLTGLVRIDRTLLANVIIDYFSDIKRLKDFHNSIDRTNSEKVIAYTAYWFLRRRPIQVLQDDNQQSIKKLSTINERFALQYILNYLSERERGSHILLRTDVGLRNFNKYMLYYLIYRLRDAQSLEMILTAFMAGQIYEHMDEDISAQLHPYDNNKIGESK